MWNTSRLRSPDCCHFFYWSLNKDASAGIRESVPGERRSLGSCLDSLEINSSWIKGKIYRLVAAYFLQLLGSRHFSLLSKKTPWKPSKSTGTFLLGEEWEEMKLGTVRLVSHFSLILQVCHPISEDAIEEGQAWRIGRCDEWYTVDSLWDQTFEPGILCFLLGNEWWWSLRLAGCQHENNHIESS